jgi:DMSO reductase family type II enzyme heme b subunit
VECLIARGFGTLTSRGPTAQVARGGARRSVDGWAVVFLHPLGAEEHDDAVVLEPGRTLSIAFAVWDGAAGDRNGQKSVTIWHRISIEK